MSTWPVRLLSKQGIKLVAMRRYRKCCESKNMRFLNSLLGYSFETPQVLREKWRLAVHTFRLTS